MKFAIICLMLALVAITAAQNLVSSGDRPVAAPIGHRPISGGPRPRPPGRKTTTAAPLPPVTQEVEEEDLSKPENQLNGGWMGILQALRPQQKPHNPQTLPKEEVQQEQEAEPEAIGHPPQRPSRPPGKKPTPEAPLPPVVEEVEEPSKPENQMNGEWTGILENLRPEQKPHHPQTLPKEEEKQEPEAEPQHEYFDGKIIPTPKYPKHKHKLLIVV